MPAELPHRRKSASAEKYTRYRTELVQPYLIMRLPCWCQADNHLTPVRPSPSMTALDLPGVRLYGPVQTAVSSPDAAPRYFLRRRGVTMQSGGCRRLHAAHVREIREWACARPWLTTERCITALRARYPVEPNTLREVLQNRSWFDARYKPTPRPESALPDRGARQGVSSLVQVMLWSISRQIAWNQENQAR